MDEWINGWKNAELLNKSKDEWMNEWTNEWKNEYECWGKSVSHSLSSQSASQTTSSINSVMPISKIIQPVIRLTSLPFTILTSMANQSLFNLYNSERRTRAAVKTKPQVAAMDTQSYPLHFLSLNITGSWLVLSLTIWSSPWLCIMVSHKNSPLSEVVLPIQRSLYIL